jgi:hypothetical protein
VQGNDAKAIDVLADKSPVSNVKIPVMPYSENKETTSTEVFFNSDEADKLSIKQNISDVGLEKWGSNYVIISEDIIAACQKKPYGISMSDINAKSLKSQLAQVMDQQKKQRDEKLTELLQYLYELPDVKISKFELVQTGMFDDAPELKYNLQFDMNRYITKTGNAIVIDAGKLIGKQVVPESSDSIRRFDIYMPYARTYENQIYVEIPQGYTVKGTNNLTFNVTNETGGFVSSAKVEGNKLVIKTSKYFTNNYFSKESWPNIRKFLTAANDFQNQKVMFVPVK